VLLIDVELNASNEIVAVLDTDVAAPVADDVSVGSFDALATSSSSSSSLNSERGRLCRLVAGVIAWFVVVVVVVDVAVVVVEFVAVVDGDFLMYPIADAEANSAPDAVVVGRTATTGVAVAIDDVALLVAAAAAVGLGGKLNDEPNSERIDVDARC
jgi:hypothetical protein